VISHGLYQTIEFPWQVPPSDAKAQHDLIKIAPTLFWWFWGMFLSRHLQNPQICRKTLWDIVREYLEEIYLAVLHYGFPVKHDGLL
jgi:hypothetical protein